jgi:hypothetical protein
MTDIGPVAPEGRICKAAIVFKGKTYLGWRHAEIRNMIMQEDDSREDIMHTMHNPWAVGFITENGRFLTRNQALIYGRNHGQIGDIIGSELTSEDLWDADGTPKGN